MDSFKSREPFVVVDSLSYRPDTAEEDILKNISFNIYKGDFILLLGPSGCGKSMLTRCLNGLIPHLEEGELSGKVLVGDLDTRINEPHEFCSKIGIVFQNPGSQILSLKVIDEVAWGVENLGFETDEIRKRTDYWMELVGISDLRGRLTFAISGGQKQKVSVASNLAMEQDMLMLDDPTTDLDPVCEKEVIEALEHLHKEEGMTILIIEHSLDELIELANRVLLMEDGRIVRDCPPKKMFARHYEDLVRLGVNIPQHIEIVHTILNGNHEPENFPVKKEDAFSIFKDFISQSSITPPKPQEKSKSYGDVVVDVQNIDYAYDPDVPVLKDINFKIREGEFLAIIGANGSGKSTLIKNLIGLLKPVDGDVIISGKNTKSAKVHELARRIGYVFQNPDNQLFESTVEKEVGFSLYREKGEDKLPEDEIKNKVTDALQFVGLENLRDRHPFSLSRGQRQCLAVATALVHDPSIVLLDEPTTGQDIKGLSGLLNFLQKQNLAGNTTIMVTHDMRIVVEYATRVIVLAGGEIVANGSPEEIFYSRFETLKDLNLAPPTFIDFCRRLDDINFPRYLTLESLIECLRVMKSGFEMEGGELKDI